MIWYDTTYVHEHIYIHIYIIEYNMLYIYIYIYICIDIFIIEYTIWIWIYIYIHIYIYYRIQNLHMNTYIYIYIIYMICYGWHRRYALYIVYTEWSHFLQFPLGYSMFRPWPWMLRQWPSAAKPDFRSVGAAPGKGWLKDLGQATGSSQLDRAIYWTISL